MSPLFVSPVFLVPLWVPSSRPHVRPCVLACVLCLVCFVLLPPVSINSSQLCSPCISTSLVTIMCIYCASFPSFIFRSSLNPSSIFIFFVCLFFNHRFLKSPNLNKRFWAIVRPTNGAFTLFLALHICDTVS